jgi:hypothetical protein
MSGRAPMIECRPFKDGEDRGWLKAKHHFSFSGFDDPARMGCGALRVWNADENAPNPGFPPHAHANMRIDARDGAAIKDVAVVRITAVEDAEVVMVDTP